MVNFKKGSANLGIQAKVEKQNERKIKRPDYMEDMIEYESYRQNMNTHKGHFLNYQIP